MPPSTALPSPPIPLKPDQQTVFDALCVMQAPINLSRLAELLADHRMQRGVGFYGQELRRLLAELHQAGLAISSSQGQWWVTPGLAWPRFAALVQQPEARERWWAAWRRLFRFDNTWHLELFGEEAMVGAIRVVVHAGRTPAVFERLCQLSRQASPESPGLLAVALLRPFDALLWDRIDPELRLRLLIKLLGHLGGDNEALTLPLWHWLLDQSQPRADVLHDHLRLRLAERLVLAGQRDDARRVLLGLDDPAAQALRAAADIAEGQHGYGALAFELAWKERSALSGKRKQLFDEPTSWFYLLALIAQPEPAAWTKARKFAAGEAGKRDADAYTFWGVWQEAIDQRLGDAPRNVRVFALAPLHSGRLHGLHQLSHLLLAAWLGLRPPYPAQLAGHSAALAQGYDSAGLPWLAMMVRRATCLLLDTAPSAADAAQPFPVGAPAARWREALNAIVALGPVGGSAAAGASVEADRLIWTVAADALGRVRQVKPLEQKAGARGLGKPKAVSLVNLSKRADLPAHDAAVLRAIRKQPFGGQLVIDKLVAVQALVRHPQVAWADDPLQFIELNEALPQLEVLTRGEFLQFRVVDPIRPDDAALAAADASDLGGDDDADDDDEWESEIINRRYNETSRPAVLLLRDGPDRARLLRISFAQARVAELVSQGWQVPVAARTEMDAALRVLGTHFQLTSDADAGAEVQSSSVLRAELTPQGDGLSLRLVAAPFGDFGPRPGPGQGRERLTTVHQGLTLSTRRDLAAERASLLALTSAVDWLDDSDPHWLLDQPEQALAVVEAIGRLAPAIVAEWPKGKALKVKAVSAA